MQVFVFFPQFLLAFLNESPFVGFACGDRRKVVSFSVPKRSTPFKLIGM